MKRNLLAGAFLFAISFNPLFAQESVDSPPYSDLIQITDYENQLPEFVLAAPDLRDIIAEDEIRSKNGEFDRFGITQPVQLNFMNSGVWSLLPNGDRIWRLKITTEGAVSNALFYNDFYLPEGAKLHIYTPDKSQIIGAFTSYNNPENGYFSTDNIYGESCIIEYYEPVSQAGKGRINIVEIGYGYRYDYKENFDENIYKIDESDVCQVDVACTPESTGWADVIKSVVRIRVKVGSSYGYCSGTVVNNTGQDCTPYVLTAWHCVDGATTANFSQWSIYFKYQKSACGSGTAPTNNAMTGCTMRANSNDAGGDTGSDFLLIEMNSLIPGSYTPYFSGWDRSTYSAGTTSGVSVHHPAGDCKKISTYENETVSSASWGGSVANTHWRFKWTATTNGHGVTEGGSSGSGLFRLDNKLLWGTLTGGASYCSNTAGKDLYGKMSFHWTSNGTVAAEQLKPWLDPTSSNVNTLTGTYYPCVNSVEDHSLNTLISVYPNPSSGIIHLDISDVNIDDLTVKVYNLLGELVFSTKIYSGIENYSINLANEADGVYLVTVSSAVQTISKKVILEK